MIWLYINKFIQEQNITNVICVKRFLLLTVVWLHINKTKGLKLHRHLHSISSIMHFQCIFNVDSMWIPTLSLIDPYLILTWSLLEMEVLEPHDEAHAASDSFYQNLTIWLHKKLQKMVYFLKRISHSTHFYPRPSG